MVLLVLVELWDLGWAGGSHGVSFGQELEYAVGA